MDSYLADLGAALSTLNSLTIILSILAGVAVGIVLGALPGFGSSQALALLFPVTFAMTVDQAVLFLIAVYSAVEYGSSIPAILIRTPGTGASAVTVLDGYAMARQGLARRALRISLYSGVIGGTTSTIIFIVAGTSLGYVALAFGPGELFAVGVFGLAIVGGFFGKDAARGFLAVGIGLLFATVGSSGFGGLRFTFNQGYLMDGIPLVVVIIGFLAGPEAFRLLVDNRRTASGEAITDSSEQKARNRITRADVKLLIPTWIRGSLLGTLAGAIPGAGGSVGALLAYSEEKRWSKRPEKFGTGIPEGVVASEAGNSATAGGGLIPMIALGIPGSAVDAILMASLMVHGISVGPRLIMDNADLVYGMFIAMVVSSLMMLVICVFSMRFFLKVTDIPKWLIVPAVIVCCVVGSFALNNRLTDLYLLGFIGLAGYALKSLDYPLAPLVLGVILGPIAETNLRRALMTENDWTVFLTRPISLLFLLAAVASVAWAIRKHRRSKTTARETVSE